MSGVDYLDVKPDSFELSSSSPSSLSRSSFSSSENETPIAVREPRRSKTKSVSSFITKLYSLVQEPNHQDLVHWSPSGQTFLITNVKKFGQRVLPEYFKHRNFSSFVRLLNMYGFHKINKSARGQRGSENEIWEFSHPRFRQGQPELLKEIRRKTMESEVLRRETGDIQALFSNLQLSQADLQLRLQSLQSDFSLLLQGFEETRTTQLQQQILLQELAQKQGVALEQLMDPNPSLLPPNLLPSNIAPNMAVSPGDFRNPSNILY